MLTPRHIFPGAAVFLCLTCTTAMANSMIRASLHLFGAFNTSMGWARILSSRWDSLASRPGLRCYVVVPAANVFTSCLILAVLGMWEMTFPGMADAANHCINNLRQIDCAKDAYVLEHWEGRLAEKYGTNYSRFTPTWDDLSLYIKDATNRMYCPSLQREYRGYNRNYRINPIGTDPECLARPGTSNAPRHSLAYKAGL